MKRRSFLKTTLVTTAYGMAPFNILRAGESPNSKLNVAIVDVALMHPNRTLEWDAAKMQITNDEQANNSSFMRHDEPRDHMAWV